MALSEDAAMAVAATAVVAMEVVAMEVAVMAVEAMEVAARPQPESERAEKKTESARVEKIFLPLQSLHPRKKRKPCPIKRRKTGPPSSPRCRRLRRQQRSGCPSLRARAYFIFT